MSASFNLVVGLIVIQTVLALLALAWALYTGQLSGLEKKGRRVFFDDLEHDRDNNGEEGG